MNTAFPWSIGLRNAMVRLVPLQTEDFERLYAIASDPLIWEQHPDRERYKREVFQHYFDSAIASGTAFLIHDAQTGELIGCTRYYDPDPITESIVIGYTFLVRKCWGGVFNKACKTLMLEHAFQFVDHVYFHIGSGNLRSQKAIEKLGAIRMEEPVAAAHGAINYIYRISKIGYTGNTLK